MEDNKLEEYLKILKENEHYEVFPIIYSVKDILCKYSGEQYIYDTCQLCFIEPIASYNGWHNEKEEGFEETENMNMCVVNNLAKTKDEKELLCKKCTWLHSKNNVLELIEDILNKSYYYDGIEQFKKFIKLFEKYVSKPYEKLLLEYFSHDMNKFYFYHKERCEHFLRGTDNGDIYCPYILDIIENITDLYYTDYLTKCPIQYIDILIKKGIDINHVFDYGKFMGGQTVFGGLLHCYLEAQIDYHDAQTRMNTLVSLGADVNFGAPLKYIADFQYNNRPSRIEKIKYLKEIGLDFSNKCIYDCMDKEDCLLHKMLYDTKLGKLIQTL